LIDSLGLSERVTIFKDVPHEQIPAFLFQAQLFVLASRREGHPLAVIEPGTAGLPVVCTRAFGLWQLISEGLAGRIVEVDDVAGLAHAIIDLLTHPDEAKRLATNFHEYSGII